jgi:gamma-D-glutamyl-L-lysine dipeptidyl-peptidase
MIIGNNADCGNSSFLTEQRRHTNMYFKLKTLLFFLSVMFLGSFCFAQNVDSDMIKSEIQKIQKQYAPDKRTAIFDVSILDANNKTILIKGETNQPEAKKQIVKLISSIGIQLVDSIRLLPDTKVGEKIWGLAALSVSNMRAKPDHEAELVSQALMGTPLKILDMVDGWYRVQTPDQYIGWMDGGGVTRFKAAEMDIWKKSDRYVYWRIFGSVIDAPDKKGKVISDIVLCDLFEVESETKGYLKIRFPNQKTGYVRKKDCISWQQWTENIPDKKALLNIAGQMMGFPYLWGGTSSKSADCSGFTKTAYYSQGIVIARDASQQSLYGKLLDIKNTENLVPGDLLFFGRSEQRVTHTGIYLGNSQYLHASSSNGKVHVNSIDPKNQDYILTEQKRLVVARRILNNLDTEGIVSVKLHPWYSEIKK